MYMYLLRKADSFCHYFYYDVECWWWCCRRRQRSIDGWIWSEAYGLDNKIYSEIYCMIIWSMIVWVGVESGTTNHWIVTKGPSCSFFLYLQWIWLGERDNLRGRYCYFVALYSRERTLSCKNLVWRGVTRVFLEPSSWLFRFRSPTVRPKSSIWTVLFHYISGQWLDSHVRFQQLCGKRSDTKYKQVVCSHNFASSVWLSCAPPCNPFLPSVYCLYILGWYNFQIFALEDCPFTIVHTKQWCWKDGFGLKKDLKYEFQ